MLVKKNRKGKYIPWYEIVSDFETRDVIIENQKFPKPEVIQWGIKGIFDKEPTFHKGLTIDTWYVKLMQLAEVHPKIKVYFHNLGRYDGWFIIPYLLKLGYQFIDIEKSKYIEPIINEQNRIIAIDIKNREWDSKRKKKITKTIRFLDSQNFFNLSLAKIGSSIGLPKLDPCNDYVYKKYNTIEEVPKEEWEYLERDLDIPRTMFKEMAKIVEKSKWGFTLSQTAYEYWKDTSMYGKINEWSMNKVELEELWKELKKGYRGGITKAQDNKTYKVIDKVWKYDVNSLYPTIMYNNPMPTGLPLPRDKWPENVEDNDNLFKFYRVIPKTNLVVRPNMFPFIPTKKTFSSYEYGDKLPKGEYIYMTHEELILFRKTYKGKWEEQLLYVFNTVNNMFSDYINKFMDLKIKGSEEGNEVLRLLSKLFMNTLYGKMGQNIMRKSKVLQPYNPNATKQLGEPELDEDGEIIEDSSVNYGSLVMQEEMTKKSKNIAIAIAITSGSRMILLDAINKNYKDFVYCDTDSVHLLKPQQGLEIHNSKLGAWDFEGIGHGNVYRRAKQYYHTKTYHPDKDKWEGKTIKIAGFPRASALEFGEQITTDHFINGFEIPNGKIITTIVPTGIVWSTMDYKVSGLDGGIKYIIKEGE